MIFICVLSKMILGDGMLTTLWGISDTGGSQRGRSLVAWELVKNAILQPHPRVIDSEMEGRASNLCFNKYPHSLSPPPAPPGDALKIENGCQRTWGTPVS